MSQGPPPIPKRPTSAIAGSVPMNNQPAAASSSSSSSTAPVSAEGGDGSSSSAPAYQVSAKVSVQDLLSKDAEDKDLALYKQKLLGSGGGAANASDARLIVFNRVELQPTGHTPILIDVYDQRTSFTLKEGVDFRPVLFFKVQNDIVSGLKYICSIKKMGITVDTVSEMIGSFAPSEKLIEYKLPEETAPSGFLMRGSYSAEGKLQDDDGKIHVQWTYKFEIKSNW